MPTAVGYIFREGLQQKMENRWHKVRTKARHTAKQIHPTTCSDLARIRKHQHELSPHAPRENKICTATAALLDRQSKELQ